MPHFIYNLLLHLLLPLVLLRLGWRAWRNPAYRQRWWERLSATVSAELRTRPCLWVHAVSVGEVLAALPVLRRLQVIYPDDVVLVTTTTPTGAQMLRARLGDRLGESVIHRYFPLDLPWLLRPFLRRLQPRLLVVMETELWPNLLAACQRHGIPVLIANARLSARALRRYQRIRPLMAATLQAVRGIACQTEADARHFQALGARPDQIRVLGNLKYDFDPPADLAQRTAALAHYLQPDVSGMARPVWIAISTHAGEEAVLLQALDQIKAQCPGALCVLVPRHPERCTEVARLCQRAERRYVLRSSQQPVAATDDLWLIDSLGEVFALLGLAQVACVGGSLVPVGGHNPLEAAAQAVPVVTGPHIHNFAEVYRLLFAAGAAVSAETAEQIARHIVYYLVDETARQQTGQAGLQVFNAQRGAAVRLEQWLREWVVS